ncbi:ANTAR domain-containing response regulator [Pelagibius marinus]|uniref:ANTAR domain-containing response regulator n=1 Tax=Pelagibius marinus TaxID=2762760 RepID=UPI002AC338F4|nr:ANTAR domain-containing protein [Pelagibius marinus]
MSNSLSTMKIAVVDPQSDRADVIEEGLRDAGYRDIHHISEMSGLLERLSELAPDVILIDLENPNRDVLEQMFEVSRLVSRPIAMFVDDSDMSMIEAAVEAGVGAYVVDGMKKERIKNILATAITRFNTFSRLQSELQATKAALAERKVIDRAKGILMKAKGLSEEEAYALMRKTAMSQSKKLSEIAQSIVTAAELLS